MSRARGRRAGHFRARSTRRQRFGLLRSRRLRQALLLLAILGLAFWGWRAAFLALGAGLPLALAYALALGLAVRRQGWAAQRPRWNKWLGALALTLAVFMLFSFIKPYSGMLARDGLSGQAGAALEQSAGRAAAVFATIALGLLGFGLLLPAAAAMIMRRSATTSSSTGQSLGRSMGRLFSWSRHSYAEHPLHRTVIERAAQARLPVIGSPLPIPRPAARLETVTEPPPPPAETADEGEGAEAEPEAVAVRSSGRWQLPSIDLLEEGTRVEMSQAELDRRSRLLEEALASYGVEGKVVEVNQGPAVTRFGVEPGWARKFKEIKGKDRNGLPRSHMEETSRTRVKVDRIATLSNDLALALSAPSVRVEAPVPGKSYVGIEVPNASMNTVTLREVLEGPNFMKSLIKSKLTVALGKGTGSEIVPADLAKMPHLLIAGATGSGKTVCLHTVITSLLMNNTPDELRFLMVDPKRVELVAFSGLPHQATPVITECADAVEAMKWATNEMDNRYRKFAAVGARNIDAYNKSRRITEPMPFLVIVIDELADLMMASAAEMEPLICRIAQLGRAAGVHEVVATQRPSVDVITGLIKANFPARLSFAVASQIDSRTILDSVGAEKLLGRGDMLFLPPDALKPRRVQGCYVSDAEIDRLVRFWTNQQAKQPEAAQQQPAMVMPLAQEDPLIEEARKLMAGHKQVSPSFLQRRLKVGHSRAVQIFEMLQPKEEPGEPPLPGA